MTFSHVQTFFCYVKLISLLLKEKPIGSLRSLILSSRDLVLLNWISVLLATPDKMDPYSVFAWIFFYIVVICMFYWCFRQSMIRAAASDSSSNRNTTTASNTETNNQRHHSNERRMASRVSHNRNVYLITDSNRPSDASDHHRPPPEYKWEDLPPTYEEAVASFTNPAFNEQPTTTTTTTNSPNNNSTSNNQVVIELQETVPSVNAQNSS